MRFGFWHFQLGGGTETITSAKDQSDAIEVVTLITTAMSGTGASPNVGAGPSRQPQKPPAKNPPVVTPGSGNNIIVNQRQVSTP